MSASFVLAGFFALAGIALDQAFKEGAEQAIRERLQIHVYALLSAADLSRSGKITLPKSLPEARFSHPGSGLYAYVFSSTGQTVWRSESSLVLGLGSLDDLTAGKATFIRDHDNRFVLYYPVMWENESGTEWKYVFAVAEDASSFMQQVSAFRHSLWVWFSCIGFILIIVQLGILRWSLKPLRLIAKDLEAIEAGRKSRLDDQYPKELQGLAINLNALIDSERTHLERYRNTLADLAHSLKTPLAILRGIQSSETLDSDLRNTLKDQVTRMDDLVEYQLHRAAARGHKHLSLAVDVPALIKKVIASLDKVYSDRKITCILQANKTDKYFCEEGDLYEIAGNLIDNAYKWCESRVLVSVILKQNPGRKRNDLHLSVEDDGPGIPKEKIAQVLKRGIRADERIDGHGIGLAVVNEIVHLSGGELKAGTSSLGGTRWDVLLPALI